MFAATVAGVITWMVVRRKVPGLRGWGLTLALAALVLGGPGVDEMSGTLRDGIFFVADTAVPEGGSSAGPLAGYQLSPAAGAAAAWLNQHTPNDAVIASNRHCIKGPQRPKCPSLVFWVSGLGGRRTVLEGWGYTSAAKWPGAPTPFPERLAANDIVFTDPSTANIHLLRQRYGASWLVADTSAGPVSPQLPRFAAPKFSSGQITIYQLH